MVYKACLWLSLTNKTPSSAIKPGNPAESGRHS
jgi:hypothetical protein